MRVVLGLDDLVARYLEERLGLDVVGEAPFKALAIVNGQDQFVAGIVVANYTGHSCEISMASETTNWGTKGILSYIAKYLFGKLGCARVQCTVKKHRSTYRTRKFLEKGGFKLEGCLRRAYDGTHDALVFGLLPEDCRFLGGQNVTLSTEGAGSARPVPDSGSANTVQ